VPADLLAEGLPFVGVAQAGVQAGLGKPDRTGCHRVAPLVDGAHGDQEALALLADPVLDRDRNVVEVDQAGVAGPDAELAVEGAGGQPGHAAFEHERRHAPVAFRAIDRGKEQEVVGEIGDGDPDLLAVEPVDLAVTARRGREVGSVGPHTGFGQRERRQLVATGLWNQPALALFLRPPLEEGQRVQPDVDALDDAECGVGPLQLFAQQGEADVVHAGAAVGLRDRRAKEALLAHPIEDLPVDLAALVPFADVGQDLGLGEGAGGVTDQPVLVAQAEVDHRPMLAGAIGHAVPRTRRSRAPVHRPYTRAPVRQESHRP
jgi:hypothetical protein